MIQILIFVEKYDTIVIFVLFILVKTEWFVNRQVKNKNNWVPTYIKQNNFIENYEIQK